MYIYLSNNTVTEIIPDKHPAFPGVPIERRYSPEFVRRLMHVPDDTEVRQNWVYDPETGSFAPPPEPEEDEGVTT